MSDEHESSVAVAANPDSESPSDSRQLSWHHKLFLGLVVSHFVLTCRLSLIYYELWRTGSASPAMLFFDALGCFSLYFSAGLIAAGNTRIKWMLFSAAISLATAAWIWRWLPGWWLIPAYGAAVSCYGFWLFRESKWQSDSRR